MIRFLNGLNHQDAIQEFAEIGVKNPTERMLSALGEGVNFKIPSEAPFAKTFIDDLNSTPLPFRVFSHPESPKGFLLHFPSPFSQVFATAKEISSTNYGALFWQELSACLRKIGTNVWQYHIPGRTWSINRPQIMGILNVTPDSFSDGGNFFSLENAYRQAMQMLEAGADIIDIGGESTRPGADTISPNEEWRRIGSVIKKLVSVKNCILSVDTCKSEIARKAADSGVHIINDISGMKYDPQIASVVAAYNLPIVLMHIQGQPQNMQKHPHYQHLAEEIALALADRCRFAESQGAHQLILDPGIGFGKRFEDNFELIRRLDELKIFGYPILLGASRKSFIGKLLDLPVSERKRASAITAFYAIQQGATILRVHDVAQTKEAIYMYEAFCNRKAV